MIERFEKFSFTMGEIHKALNKISTEEMEKFDLHGSHARYIMAMYRHEDGITAAKLAEECDRNKADVSRAMSVLEVHGLIKKSNADANYRVLLSLTEEGKKIAVRLRERASLAVRAAGQGLSDEHRIILYNALELIAANLQTISEEGIPEK